MSEDDFNTSHRRNLGMYLNGDAIQGRGTYGQKVRDDSFLVLMNANAEVKEWKLPAELEGEWHVMIDTSGERAEGDQVSNGSLAVPGRSTVVLVAAGAPARSAQRVQDPA